MANELKIIGPSPNGTVYAVATLDRSALVADQVNETTAEMVVEDWPNYVIPFTESPAGSNYFYADLPAFMFGRRWNIAGYLQSGSSPVPSDIFLGGTDINEAGVLLGTVIGAEPVSIQEAKKQCNVEESFNDDDQFILHLITSAREWCEQYQGRAYIPTNCIALFDEFDDDELVLPIGPVISITSVNYRDTAGVWQELDASAYDVNNYVTPGAITPVWGTSWPSTGPKSNAVRVEYIAGYESRLPVRFKQAMLLLIGWWYRNREAIGDIKGSPLAFSVASLLDPDRVIHI